MAPESLIDITTEHKVLVDKTMSEEDISHYKKRILTLLEAARTSSEVAWEERLIIFRYWQVVCRIRLNIPYQNQILDLTHINST